MEGENQGDVIAVLAIVSAFVVTALIWFLARHRKHLTQKELEREEQARLQRSDELRREEARMKDDLRSKFGDVGLARPFVDSLLKHYDCSHLASTLRILQALNEGVPASLLWEGRYWFGEHNTLYPGSGKRYQPKVILEKCIQDFGDSWVRWLAIVVPAELGVILTCSLPVILAEVHSTSDLGDVKLLIRGLETARSQVKPMKIQVQEDAPGVPGDWDRGKYYYVLKTEEDDTYSSDWRTIKDAIAVMENLADREAWSSVVQSALRV
jgi:hypothetical protein